MTHIEQIISYNYDGKGYKSLREIKEAIENRISSEIIDGFGVLTPKLRLEILSVLTNKVSRELLVDLLTTTYEYEDSDVYIKGKNILDI